MKTEFAGEGATEIQRMLQVLEMFSGKDEQRALRTWAYRRNSNIATFGLEFVAGVDQLFVESALLADGESVLESLRLNCLAIMIARKVEYREARTLLRRLLDLMDAAAEGSTPEDKGGPG